MTITWKYRCSICGELVHPGNVQAHLKMEKEKPDWPGVMEWTRVDDE